ncbi:acyl-CoA thioester hydrolase [Litorivivens lipolytica]|uniref:Acyl-CoA thioester hydrolase n=1 Tax=Litorivivens lipolytica TaxID=1524264 RepID=A0A7W4W3M4_9GAMM|nr:acyl-CoA thioester hydrolase [Litorivivens lipolytica]
MKSFPLKPRFSETDAMGHINNTSIAVWFETARLEFLTDVFIDKGDGQPNWFMASQTIDYLSENLFGIEVRMDLSVIHIGNTSFKVGCKMYQNDKQTVRASAVLVHVDLATKKPTPIHDRMRAILEQELDADWL